MLIARFIIPIFSPEAAVYGMIATVVGSLGIVLWWLFFSRAPWKERLGAVALMIVAVLLTSRLVHISILKGAMGMLFYFLAIPLMCIAFVAWAVLSRRLSGRPRWVSMIATIFLACGVWIFLRTGGFTADADNDFAWRWSKTPEERLLEKAEKESLSASAASREALAKVNWPGFRGPNRDGILRGVQIKTDWSTSPPVEIWRRPIGPGWSSFAVSGNLFYTQEQRGEDEVVACYNATTGEPVWRHRDAARFWESNAGAGPRGTPTLSNGRVYTFGATGILNALDAADGKVVWSRNAATDTKVKTPGWGFSSSPLVIDDVVIVAVAGKLAAYDIATGKPRWFGPDGKGGYSSPHLVTIDGIPQVLLVSGVGVTSVKPADGTVLWKHSLAGNGIVQPALTEDGDILISEGDGKSLHRIELARQSGGWTMKELWNTIALKPYFNDFVVHKGHAFGFDGSFLACIDTKDGNRKWKGGRFGHGQLVLLADQDLLLVLSEKGELGLVKAAIDKYTELARLPAIKGKTWNHPVLAGDTLLVRNGEEMAAYRLALLGR